MKMANQWNSRGGQLRIALCLIVLLLQDTADARPIALPEGQASMRPPPGLPLLTRSTAAQLTVGEIGKLPRFPTAGVTFTSRAVADPGSVALQIPPPGLVGQPLQQSSLQYSMTVGWDVLQVTIVAADQPLFVNQQRVAPGHSSTPIHLMGQVTILSVIATTMQDVALRTYVIYVYRPSAPPGQELPTAPPSGGVISSPPVVILPGAPPAPGVASSTLAPTPTRKPRAPRTSAPVAPPTSGTSMPTLTPQPIPTRGTPAAGASGGDTPAPSAPVPSAPLPTNSGTAPGATPASSPVPGMGAGFPGATTGGGSTASPGSPASGGLDTGSPGATGGPSGGGSTPTGSPSGSAGGGGLPTSSGPPIATESPSTPPLAGVGTTTAPGSGSSSPGAQNSGGSPGATGSNPGTGSPVGTAFANPPPSGTPSGGGTVPSGQGSGGATSPPGPSGTSGGSGASSGGSGDGTTGNGNGGTSPPGSGSGSGAPSSSGSASGSGGSGSSPAPTTSGATPFGSPTTAPGGPSVPTPTPNQPGQAPPGTGTPSTPSPGTSPGGNVNQGGGGANGNGGENSPPSPTTSTNPPGGAGSSGSPSSGGSGGPVNSPPNGTGGATNSPTPSSGGAGTSNGGATNSPTAGGGNKPPGYQVGGEGANSPPPPGVLPAGGNDGESSPTASPTHPSPSDSPPSDGPGTPAPSTPDATQPSESPSDGTDGGDGSTPPSESNPPADGSAPPPDGSPSDPSLCVEGNCEPAGPGLLTVAGVAFDSYLQSCAVFVDLDGNQQQNSDEPSGMTDLFGQFNMSSPMYAPIILLAGGQCTDAATGVLLPGNLHSPAQARVITPLTTVMLHVAAQQGVDVVAAEQVVAAGLGLNLSSTLSVSGTDVIAAVLANQDTAAAWAVVQNTRLQNAVTMAAALLAGGGDRAAAADWMFRSLADSIGQRNGAAKSSEGGTPEAAPVGDQSPAQGNDTSGDNGNDDGGSGTAGLQLRRLLAVFLEASPDGSISSVDLEGALRGQPRGLDAVCGTGGDGERPHLGAVGDDAKSMLAVGVVARDGSKKPESLRWTAGKGSRQLLQSTGESQNSTALSPETHLTDPTLLGAVLQTAYQSLVAAQLDIGSSTDDTAPVVSLSSETLTVAAEAMGVANAAMNAPLADFVQLDLIGSSNRSAAIEFLNEIWRRSKVAQGGFADVLVQLGSGAINNTQAAAALSPASFDTSLSNTTVTLPAGGQQATLQAQGAAPPPSGVIELPSNTTPVASRSRRPWIWIVIAIAAGVGVVLLCCCCGGIAWYCHRKKKNRRAGPRDPERGLSVSPRRWPWSPPPPVPPPDTPPLSPPLPDSPASPPTDPPLSPGAVLRSHSIAQLSSPHFVMTDAAEEGAAREAPLYEQEILLETTVSTPCSETTYESDSTV